MGLISLNAATAKYDDLYQWRIRGGGGAESAAAPLFSANFFSGRFFFLLVTPEVGLVGGRYPYPIM